MQNLLQSLPDWLKPFVLAIPMLLITVGMLISIHQRRAVDRRKIEDSLAAQGWRLINAKRQSDLFSRARSIRRYDVTYQTDTGATVQAVCALTWPSGLQWISDTPPAV